MAHASGCNNNLLYPVLERVLERYREVYADDADVVNAGLSELGHELQRQAQWADDYSSLNAYIEAGKLRLDAASDATIPTPLTLPSAAEVSDQGVDIAAYGGALIGWSDVTDAGASVQLPDSVGYRAH